MTITPTRFPTSSLLSTGTSTTTTGPARDTAAPPPPVFALRTDQRETVGFLLDGLDAASATEDDLARLRDQLRSAGIPPGPELGAMLTDAGFDPGAVRTAGEGTAPPPPLPPEAVGKILDTLADLLFELSEARGSTAASAGGHPAAAGEAGAGAPSLRALLLDRLSQADAAPGSILSLQA